MIFRHHQTKKVFAAILSTSVILTMTTGALASPKMNSQIDRTSFAKQHAQEEVKSVTATNGIITVELTGNSKSSPSPDDFTFLMKTDGKKEKEITVNSFTWDEERSTAHVTFKPIAATKNKQNVAISVLFQGVKTEADTFTIAERNAKIADIKIFNRADDFVLTPDTDDSALQLTAIAEDKEGNIVAGKKATWSSDDPSIAKVDQNGMVQAVGAGTATITVKIANKSAKVKVNVTEGADTIKEIIASNGLVTVSFAKAPKNAPKLSDFAFTKQVDNKQQQKLSINSFSWDEATKLAKFAFKPLAATSKKQKVVIRVSYGDVTLDADAFDIAAKNAKVEKVEIQHLDDTELTLQSSDTEVQLIAIASNKDDQVVAGKKVLWESDSPKVATVNRNGKVYAVGVGTATITATVEDKTAKIEVTVKSASTTPRLMLATPLLSESASNDGSISMVQTITISDGAFADHLSASDVKVNQLPAGLGINVTRNSNTQLNIDFTGAALSHASTDSRSNLSVTIAKEAIEGATESITSEPFGIQFADPVVVIPPVSSVVILEAGSLGIAGNGKITGLQLGKKYIVTYGGKTYGVLESGSLGAENSAAEALGGTEITGLRNGIFYKVEEEAVATERAIVAAYRNAANEGVIQDLLVANQLGLNVLDYNGLDAASKTTVAAMLFDQRAGFTSKGGIQNALNTAVALVIEQANVAAYQNAVDAATIQALLDNAPNSLGLDVTAFSELDATGKTAVATALYDGKSAFTNKSSIQAALDAAVASEAKVAQYKSAPDVTTIETLLAANEIGLTLTTYSLLDATGKSAVAEKLFDQREGFTSKGEIQAALNTAVVLVIEQANVAAYQNAVDPAVIQALLDAVPNALGLDVTAYKQLDAIGKATVAAVMYDNQAIFASKTSIQNALDNAVSDEAKVAAYRLATDATAIETLLATNELTLALTTYNLLDTTGKSAVAAELFGQRAGFSSKDEIQSALDTAVAGEANLVAFRLAADAAAIEDLLAANELRLDVLDYNGLDATGKTAVATELHNGKSTFTSKSVIQTGLDTAVASVAKVAAYRLAPDAAAIENLLATNELALTLTSYNHLDATGKSAVAAVLVGQKAAFTTKTAIQSALDAAVASESKLGAYRNAADATSMNDLLAVNELGLDLLGYNSLDATGKTAVAIELHNGNSAFTSKSAIQTALDTAVASEAKVAAYRLATDATAIETLIATNELVLTLTFYNQLDATGKSAVAAVLVGHKAAFTTKAVIQSALDAAVTSESKLAAFRNAADSTAITDLLAANELGLDVLGYNGLDAAGKTAVATELHNGKAAFTNKSTIQTALDAAVALVIEQKKVVAYQNAVDASAIQALLDAMPQALGLDVTNYGQLDATGKTAVTAELFGKKAAFISKSAIQTTLDTAVASEAKVFAYRKAADAAAIENLLVTNELELTLTTYNQLDATGKSAVAAVLADQKAAFTTKTDIQTALDTAVANEAKLAAFRIAADAITMKNLLDANQVDLTVTAYLELDVKGMLAVAGVLMGHREAFVNKSAIQSVLDEAVENEAKIVAYRKAADSSAIKTLLDNNALSLNWGDYSLLELSYKNKVAQLLFDTKDELNNKNILQSIVQRHAAVYAIVQSAKNKDWVSIDKNTFVRSGYPISAEELPFVERSLEYKYTMRGDGVGEWFASEMDEIFQQVNNINSGAADPYYWTGIGPINFEVAGIQGVTNSNFEAVKTALTNERSARGRDLSMLEIQTVVDGLL